MSLWRLNCPRDASQPLNWPSLGQKVLLERDFYSGFFNDEKWLGALPAGGPQRKFVVLGQPGIGKSAFGWWLIAQLLRRGRTVVYSCNSAKLGTPPEMEHSVFHRGVALKTVIADLGATKRLLSDPSVVHICDSCKPTLANPCHKIMLTSPDPDMWRWFVEKEFARVAYFPLYSNSELETLRAAEFGDTLPASVMALRVKAWGPVPRQVFSCQQATVKDSILLCLSNVDLAVLQRAYNDVNASMARRPADDSPHALFLLHADRATLTSGSVSFRSDAVGLRILRALGALNYDALLRGMQQLLESRTTRLVAGNLFEIAALDSLERGGTFICRRLDDATAASSLATKSPSKLTLDKAIRTVHFGTLAWIGQGCCGKLWSLADHRFVPDSPNLAAIDSIEVGLRLFQMTTNRTSHALKVTSGRSEKEGLAAIAEELLPLMGPSRWGDESAHLEVYFVVPEGCGATFGQQNLVFYNSSGDKATGKTSRKTSLPAAPDCAAASGSEPPPVPQAVPVDRFPSSFRLLRGVKPVTVEVQQYVLEMPLSAYRASGDVDPPRDIVDEAGET